MDTVAVYTAVNIKGNLNIYYKQNNVFKSKNILNEIKISTLLNKGETEMLTLSKHISSNYFVESTDLGDMTYKCEKCSCLNVHTETQK
jgi:hypothetical protein